MITYARASGQAWPGQGRTWRGQGGQGPGWHSSRQLWPQAGCSLCPQVAPHVWGSSQGSKAGSATTPHMHMYCRGASATGYSTRHLGQPHALAAALLWPAGP